MRFALRTAAVLAALVLFAGSAAADKPKKCSLSFNKVTKIGAYEFQPGEYTLQLHGHDPAVVFADASGNETPVEAKVSAGDSKWDHTEVLSNTTDGVRQVVEVRIGGSKTSVAFR